MIKMVKVMIQKLNELYEANSYTNDKRVTVDYCENADVIVVKVCSDMAVISHLERFTEYGLMMEIIETADRLYKK